MSLAHLLGLDLAKLLAAAHTERGMTPERPARLIDPPSEVWVTLIVERRHWRDWLKRALVPRVRARVVTRCIPALTAVAVLAGMAVGLRADSNRTVQHGRASKTILADGARSRFPLGCPDRKLTTTTVRVLPASCINAPVRAGRGRIDIPPGLPFTDPRRGVLAGAVP